MSANAEFLLPSTLIILGLGFLVCWWSWKIRPSLFWGLAYLFWAMCELLVWNHEARSTFQLWLGQNAFLLSIFFQMHGLQDHAGEPASGLRTRLVLCAVTIGLTTWLMMIPDKQWAIFSIRLAFRLAITAFALRAVWHHMDHVINKVMFAVVTAMTAVIILIAAAWIATVSNVPDRAWAAPILSAAPISSNILAIIFALTTLCAVIVELVQQYKAEALSDPLSGLANRRQFDAFRQTEWRRAADGKSPLSLLMIDVDLFKAFNDTYGHAAGDQCLVHVAGIIASCARRRSDLCARFGGEEFAVVLPGTPSSNAMKIATAIRDAVLTAAIPHAASPLGVVTVSIGVATTIPSGLHDGTLLETADTNLYTAKANGRNRVEIS